MWPRVSCLHSRVHQRLKEKQTNEEIKVEIISRIRVYPLRTDTSFHSPLLSPTKGQKLLAGMPPRSTGAENAGAMKQIMNAELVDSGTQDSYQATHNR